MFCHVYSLSLITCVIEMEHSVTQINTIDLVISLLSKSSYLFTILFYQKQSNARMTHKEWLRYIKYLETRRRQYLYILSFTSFSFSGNRKQRWVGKSLVIIWFMWLRTKKQLRWPLPAKKERSILPKFFFWNTNLLYLTIWFQQGISQTLVHFLSIERIGNIRSHCKLYWKYRSRCFTREHVKVILNC